MKIFTNKRLFKKILIVLVAIILFSAVVPPKVAYASEAASTVGGALLSPVASLLIGFGDVVMNIIHDAIYDMDTSMLIVTQKDGGWGILWTILAAVAAIIVIAALAWGAAAIGVALLAKLGVAATIGVGSIVTAGLTGGVVAGALTFLAYFGDNVVFPMYQVSPEEIFKNEIDLLDVNFFDPIKEVETKRYLEKSASSTGSYNFNLNDMIKKSNNYDYTFEYEIDELSDVNSGWEIIDVNPLDVDTIWYNDTFLYNQLNTGGNYTPLKTYKEGLTDRVTKEQLNLILKEMGIPNSGITNDNKICLYSSMSNQNANTISFPVFDDRNTVDNTNDDIYYNYIGYQTFTASVRNYKDEEVAYYKVEIMYRQVTSGENEDQVSRIINYEYAKPNAKEETTTKLISLGAQLQETITKWYYTLRNFVLVVMMLILIYIGIRIMISGISSEKAKYKNMLMDWLVAICLVFVMHYIMVFAMNLVEGITNIFATVGNGEEQYVNIYEIDTDLYNNLKPELSNLGINIDDLLLEEKSENGNQLIVWDAKNLLGMARIQAALSESGTVTYIGYGLIFLVLVFYTLYFLFTYIKRALYLTFFTIIAPLVAMTYPIDKLHDGKAQAFNMWFKEYIFNLMIQPVHLLLYTILISSAFELSSTNMIYSLVAIGFMMPAEKFLRKMFGFDKAQTPGFLGGAAGAGIMMGLANKVFHKRPSKGQNMVMDGNKSGKEDKINMKDDSAVDPMLLAEGERNNNTSNISLADEQQRIASERSVLDEFEAEGALSSNWSDDDYKAFQELEREQLEKEAQLKQRKLQQAQQYKTSPEQPKSQGRPVVKKNTTGNRKNGFWARQGRGIKAAAKTYAKSKAIKFGRSLATGKPIRDIAKIGGGLFMGATGAALGASIGISSGELKNVTGYGATLGVGGYALGARDPKPHPDLERAFEEYRRAQYGSEGEYRKHLLDEQRKEVARNEKKLEELRTYLKLDDQKQARNYMEEYGDCIDAGITDMEDFATIIKAVEEEQWSREMAITAAKYYKKAGGKPKNMGKKDRENIEFQYKNIVKANGVTDEEEADRAVKTMLSNLDRYGKIKDDLTQV